MFMLIHLIGFMMGYLASRFVIWFKINKNSVVLAFTLASVMLFINITFTLVYVLYLLTDQPMILRPHSGHMSAAISEDSILYQGYIISAVFIYTDVDCYIFVNASSF